MVVAHDVRPLIIPVFIPHAACPQRCIFCDQTHTRDLATLPDPETVSASIQEFIDHCRPGRSRTEIAFYGGNFLGLEPEEVISLLKTARHAVQCGKAQGIRFSTRPDSIDRLRLDLLKGFPVTTVELGVQSMNDQVLSLCQRGHTADCSRRAVAALRRLPYQLGLQMMIGLPGQSAEDALASGRQIADLQPDFVRIYPLLVLERSALAKWYREGRYIPLALSEAVELTRDLYAQFTRRGIPVIRMGLQPTADLKPGAGVLAGPFHPAFGELVLSALWLKVLESHLRQKALQGGSVLIEVDLRILSRLKGNRNANLATLKNRLGLRQIQAQARAGLDPDTVLVNGAPCTLKG